MLRIRIRTCSIPYQTRETWHFIARYRMATSLWTLENPQRSIWLSLFFQSFSFSSMFFVVFFAMLLNHFFEKLAKCEINF